MSINIEKMRVSFFSCLLLLLLGSSLNSCILLLLAIEGENNDVHLVQMHESFQKRSLPLERVVCIEPDFLWVNQNQLVGETILNTEALEEGYQAFLKQSAFVHGVKLSIAAPNTLADDQVDYFNKLLPLKKQVLFANANQKAYVDEYESLTTKNGDEAFFGKFENEIEFDSGFGNLAKLYGTRYFSINGFVSVIDADKKKKGSAGFMSSDFLSKEEYQTYKESKSNTLFYHVLVDVKRSEILYREIRFFEESYDTQLLQNVLFNSFKMITDEDF